MTDTSGDDDFAQRIGLAPIHVDEPGIRRVRHGRGFTFRWPDGEVVRGEHRERCEALVLPPAWSDVWVCATADGHLQAVGTDDAGRRQYRYHDRWTAARRAANFDRLAVVGQRLADVRRAVDADLDHGDDVVRALAAMVGLLDASLERIGNPGSVEQFGTRGISTLSPANLDVGRRSIRLTFTGKGGVDHDLSLVDDRLAGVLADLATAGDDWVFEVDGRTLGAAEANEYLDRNSAGHLDCKDLRTWGGTAAALTARAEGEAEAEHEIADAAAASLHNTRTVARESYVHPRVFEADDDEVAGAWSASRRSRWYGRGERALLNLLEGSEPMLDAHLV